MKKTLIELTTDLKSLKYNSGEKPYVVKDINNPVSTNGLVREVTARVDDLSRISQMLVGAPGVKYLAHEAMLQQIGVQNRIKNSRDKPVKAVLNEIGKTVVGTTKIVASTLAQVPANGTGTHFIKGFRSDTYLQPSENTGILGIVSTFFGKEGTSGAAYALNGKEVPGAIKNSVFGKNFTDKYELEKDSKFSYEKTLDKELPNTTQTDHKEVKEKIKGGIPVFSKNETGVTFNTNQLTYTSNKRPVGNGKWVELTPGNISNERGTKVAGETLGESLIPSALQISEVNKKVLSGVEEFRERDNRLATLPTPVEDFRKEPKNEYQNTLWYSDYRTKNKEQRVQLGNQGNSLKEKKLTYTTAPIEYVATVVDKVNLRAVGEVDQNSDLVALYFYNINTQKFIQFRAFIDSIDDSYNADWQGTRYVGRAEEFYTYGGFSRDINISFKIAAATSLEMDPLYKKMNQLAAMTAPQYTAAGIMQGTVVRMNVGYYITNTPGIITSVKYSLVEDAPWEIGLRDPSLTNELGTSPTVLQCSVSFKAIHDFAPQNESTVYFGDIGKNWKGLGDRKEVTGL